MGVFDPFWRKQGDSLATSTALAGLRLKTYEQQQGEGVSVVLTYPDILENLKFWVTCRVECNNLRLVLNALLSLLNTTPNWGGVFSFNNTLWRIVLYTILPSRIVFYSATYTKSIFPPPTLEKKPENWRNCLINYHPFSCTLLAAHLILAKV